MLNLNNNSDSADDFLSQLEAAEQKITQLKQQTEITGIIDRIVFSSPDSGYCVLRIEHKNPALTLSAVGYMASPQEGSEYKFEGEWKNHPKYGEQFAFSSFELLLPTNTAGIARYLENTIFGIGPVRAKRMVDALGEEALEKIKADPEVLRQFEFIHDHQIEEVRDDLSKNEAQASFTASICRRGVTPRLASRIWVTYISRGVPADEIQAKIEENPFVLIDDIDRIGFVTADKIARSVNIALDSPFRLKAAVKHVLKEATGSGHVYLPFGKVAREARKLLEIDIDEMTIARMVKKMADDLNELDREGNDVFLREMYHAENQLAAQVRRLLAAEDTPKAEPEILEQMIEYEQMLQDIEYAPEQIEALKKAINSNISIITGGPGTGKTTVINSICNIYHREVPENEIYLASPTGKAAKRMEEATGREAKTIHRLLQYDPFEGGFTYGYDMPLPGPALLIIDEFSMCDVLLARDLFAAIEENIKVVLVGDVDQLPSVGPGSVLRDMINSEVVPVTRLKFNYRQANGSVVARMANEIAVGEVPALKDEGDFEHVRVLDDVSAEKNVLDCVKQLVASEADMMSYQVLAPMKKGKSGVRNLNEQIRDIVNPAEEGKMELGGYRLGDKVMVIQNNYHKGVFNGNIGRVIEVEKNKLFVQILDNDDPRPVEFGYDELDLLTLAYACTIHKYQGSECPVIIMALTNNHYIMLRRNLLYTGMTRAKDRLILVADPRAVRKAVNDNRVERRFSKLAEKLKNREEK